MNSYQKADAILCSGQILNSEEATIEYAPNAGTEAIEPGKFIAEYPGGVGLPTEQYQKIVGVAVDSVPARQGGYKPGQQCCYTTKGEVALKLLTVIVPQLPLAVLRTNKGVLKPGDLATLAQFDIASPIPDGSVIVKQHLAIGAIVPATINFTQA